MTVFEAIHDMSQPIEVLRAIRLLLAPGGCRIVDERVAQTFTAPGDEIERLMYGYSVLHGLPVGMAEQPSVGTDTAPVRIVADGNRDQGSAAWTGSAC